MARNYYNEIPRKSLNIISLQSVCTFVMFPGTENSAESSTIN